MEDEIEFLIDGTREAMDKAVTHLEKQLANIISPNPISSLGDHKKTIRKNAAVMYLDVEKLLSKIPDEELDNQNVINSWKYGIDGGLDICAGGMAYLASEALDERNSELSAIAIVSALGDRQDQGERKSFTK